MNNNSFTVEERNAALDFAYAMGLKRPQAEEVHSTDSALDFAYAMGLRKSQLAGPARRSRSNTGFAVPQPRFI